MPRMPFTIRGGREGISFTKWKRSPSSPGRRFRKDFRSSPSILLRGTGAGLVAKTYTKRNAPIGQSYRRTMSRVKITRK